MNRIKNGLIIIFLSLTLVQCERYDIFNVINGSGENSLINIIITPSQNYISLGDSIQYSATGFYEGGASADITTKVIWTSSNASVATISNQGLVSSSSMGDTLISASLDGISSDDTDSSAWVFVQQAVYVSVSTGNDLSGDGSRANPLATIGAGITEANGRAGGPWTVWVAEGTYNISNITDPSITLQLIEGISLIGGFHPLTWIKNSAVTQSIVNDISDTGGVIGPSTPKGLFYADNTITPATMIIGFYLNGTTSGANFSAAIYCSGGSPAILENYINGGSASSSSYAIYVSGGSPFIIRNMIDGGDSNFTSGIRISGTSSPIITNNSISAGDNPSSSNTTGIFLGDSGNIPQVYNNTVFGGLGTASSYGVRAEQSSNALIYNNTIDGGSAPSADVYAVSTAYGGVPQIINNIIYTSGGTNRYGIYEFAYVGADPSVVKNNNIFNCPTALYRDYDVAIENKTTIAEVNNDLDAGALTGNNISVNPQLGGANNMQLTPLTPTVVLDGGLNGIDEAWLQFPMNYDSEPIDKADKIRPGAGDGPWTIGAFQE